MNGCIVLYINYVFSGKKDMDYHNSWVSYKQVSVSKYTKLTAIFFRSPFMKNRRKLYDVIRTRDTTFKRYFSKYEIWDVEDNEIEHKSWQIKMNQSNPQSLLLKVLPASQIRKSRERERERERERDCPNRLYGEGKDNKSMNRQTDRKTDKQTYIHLLLLRTYMSLIASEPEICTIYRVVPFIVNILWKTL